MTNPIKNSNFTFFLATSDIYSQWHPSKFEHAGQTFISCEQFMMHKKALLFGDNEIADKVMAWSNDPMAVAFLNHEIDAVSIVSIKENLDKWKEIHAAIKNLGREVKNYDESVWIANRVSIVFMGNYEKFSQNPQMKQTLLSTAGTRLVEAAHYDKVWGIGLRATDPEAQNESTWKGLNLLGDYVLTPLRSLFELEQK